MVQSVPQYGAYFEENMKIAPVLERNSKCGFIGSLRSKRYEMVDYFNRTRTCLIQVEKDFGGTIKGETYTNFLNDTIFILNPCKLVIFH